MCSAHVTEVSSASSDSSLFLHAPAGLLWFLPQMNLLIVVCLVFFYHTFRYLFCSLDKNI